jgi:hypothetical protein
MKRAFLSTVFVATSAVVVAGCGSTEAPSQSPSPQTYDAPRSFAASNDRPSEVRLTWSAPANAAGLTGYGILRDGAPIAEVPASTTALDDTAATAASLAAPALHATDGTAETVKVSWTPTDGTGKAALHAYAAVARYGATNSAPAEATGSRLGIVTGYDLSRDDGVTWTAFADSRMIYDDEMAPKVPLVLPAPLVTEDQTRSIVVVELPTTPTAGEAASVTYRVRARSGERIGDASLPAVGRRRAGRLDAVAIQWQRSADGTDAAYADIPGVTGRKWFDRNAPTAERFFRARATAWADGVSAGAPARATHWKEVSVTSKDVCGIRERDDRVVCWGDGVTTPPPEAMHGMTGTSYHCALRNDGDRLVCWGLYAGRNVVSPTTTESFVSVLAANQICGIRKSDHKVVCWTPEGAPSFESTQSYASIGMSDARVCGARQSDGHVWCWQPGSAPETEIATGAYAAVTADVFGSVYAIRTTDRRVDSWSLDGTPSNPFPGQAFRSFAHNERCALTEPDGRLICWGHTSLPYVKSDYAAVSIGPAHSCGILATGQMTCWGYTSGDAARALPPDDPFDQGSIVSGYGCGTRVGDGRVVCWGVDNVRLPRAFPSEAFKAVTLDEYATCVLGATNGKVSCWSTLLGAPPSSASVFSTIVPIPSGACGIRTSDQKLECFGAQAQPVDSVVVKAIAGAGDQFCAVLANGKPKCWRRGRPPGQGPTPEESVNTFKAMSVSALTCGIVATDGSLECWGEILQGKPIPNLPRGPFKSISSYAHSGCGIREADDRVECWSRPGFGTSETGIPPTDPMKALVEKSMCGLRLSDSKLVCWNQRTPGTPTL